jgi:hypothetical protein
VLGAVLPLMNVNQQHFNLQGRYKFNLNVYSTGIYKINDVILIPLDEPCAK